MCSHERSDGVNVNEQADHKCISKCVSKTIRASGAHPCLHIAFTFSSYSDVELCSCFQHACVKDNSRRNYKCQKAVVILNLCVVFTSLVHTFDQ